MKKILLLGIMIIGVFALSACDLFGGDDKEDIIDQIQGDLLSCEGSGDFIVVEGVCIPTGDLVSKEININGSETQINYLNTVELMDEFVADLSGSTGLAVVSRDIFEEGMLASEVPLAGEIDEDTENLIVKLNEEGFFELVSFSDDTGLDVEITSNPLALEVFGEFTVIIFEVDLGYDDPNMSFMDKINNSLYAGGIYLVHNETGKLFATKEIEYTEYNYIQNEDHSRMVNLTVTLNEPVIEMYQKDVLDEFGMPLLDVDGNIVFETVEIPLLDEDGNPVIFTEGPIQTEFLETQLFNYYEVPLLDELGEPLFDEFGQKIFEIVEEAVLDENGEAMFDVQEVPVLDENGDFVFVEEFEVEFYIQDTREITITEYSANVTDNPLSQVARRFVDKIMYEYYDWNYYRVSNYRLDFNGFANNQNSIFYIEWMPENDGQQMLKKLYFDPEFGEIVIENYLDISGPVGFDQCELFIDPINNNIICNNYDSDIKVYTEEVGLVIIADSDQLQPVIFPNGELYFYDYQDQYVEELGYSTTSLYTIDTYGVLSSHFIELGERNNLCYGDCMTGLSVEMFTAEGESYGGDWNYADIVIHNGDPVYYEAELVYESIGEFDATRPDCDNLDGCWYDVTYQLLNELGEVEMNVRQSGMYYPEDPAPSYVINYNLDENTVYQYQKAWSQIDKYCENEIGCGNQINLRDYSINEYGTWMYQNVIIDLGDKLIQEIVLDSDNDAVYEYVKEVNGEVCEGTSCYRNVPFIVYDLDGEQVSNDWFNIEYATGETVPLRVEYNITNDTDIVYSLETCNFQYGCRNGYDVDGNWINIEFEQGDLFYQSITFAETDENIVLNETLERETCTEVNGCYYNDSVYEIVDSEGVPVYTFTDGLWVEYGYTAPYQVTATLDQVTVIYEKEGTEENAICLEASCTTYTQLYLANSTDNPTHLGGIQSRVLQGERMLESITVSSDSLDSVEDQNTCTELNGCTRNTSDYKILDLDGIEIQNEDNEWSNLPVFFEFGELMPVDDNFTATFQIQNPLYQKQRVSIHEFIYRMDQAIVLDDNLFLIEKDSWSQGDDNFILTFNEETDRYLIKFTNMSAVLEITEFGEGFIAINDSETAIIEFTYNGDLSSEDYYYFDVVSLTEGFSIFGVNDLIVDFDGSIYFKGINSFIDPITGSINELGEIVLDTEVVEHEVIRVRPIN